MKFLTVIILFLWLNVSAQDSLSNWTLLKTYPVNSDAVWNIDVLENVYIVHNRMIIKFDSTGVTKFSQSIKSIGQVKEIMPINTMKLVLFSEDQQVLCLLDNTLTMSEELVDLSEFNIVNASLTSTSSQPEKIWVLDQLNSRLLLIDLAGKMQFQEVRNLKGMLNLTLISSLKELNGHLFMVGSGKVYQFDIYGTLLNELEYGERSNVIYDAAPFGERFYWVQNDALIGQDLDGENKKRVQLPVKDVLEFKKAGDIYYFRTADKILKYAFKNTR